MIDTDADDHDIVDNSKAAFAADPFAYVVPQLAISQDCGLVKIDSSLVELLGYRKFGGMKKIPGRSVDNCIWSMSENVNDRVRRVQDARFRSKICP
jgi:hypothetical protein